MTDITDEVAAEVLAEAAEAASDLAMPAVEAWDETDLSMPLPAVATRQTMDDEAMVQLFATVPQDLAELRRLAADNQW